MFLRNYPLLNEQKGPHLTRYPFEIKVQETVLISSDLEHCGAANFTDGFGCFLSVLHRYGLSILTFSFCATLYTVHHLDSPPFPMSRDYFQAKYSTSSAARMIEAKIKLLTVSFL